MSITYRPLHDFRWENVRRSRLRWEECEIGDVIYTRSTLAQTREAIFRSAAKFQTDYTWTIERDGRRWRCTRVA